MSVYGLVKPVTSQPQVALMSSNHRSHNLVRIVSAEVTCIVEDKKADAIYRAIRPDMSELGRDVKINLRLNADTISFQIVSDDLGTIKAFLSSYLKMIGAASSSIDAVSV